MKKRYIFLFSFIGMLTILCSGCKLARMPYDQINVNDVIQFGKYRQNTYEEDKETIEWIVLEKQNGRALLLCKNVIEWMPYDDEYEGSIYWSECSLREWLNTDFLEENFQKYEQERILYTNHMLEYSHVYAPDYQRCTIETEDRIFLLTNEDFFRYVKDTDYEVGIPTGLIDSKADPYRVIENTEALPWELMSPGDCWQSMVDERGEIQIYVGRGGFRAYTTWEEAGKYVHFVGVRPAMWIELDDYKGENSVEDEVVSGNEIKFDKSDLSGEWIATEIKDGFPDYMYLFGDGTGEWDSIGITWSVEESLFRVNTFAGLGQNEVFVYGIYGDVLYLENEYGEQALYYKAK